MLKKSNQKGFTIIEVLIVLAIAAVIMLLVFLAVPALQRNNRNTQRKADVSALIGAMQEYTTNNNGALPAVSTDFTGNAKLSIFDPTDVSYNVRTSAFTTLPAYVAGDENKVQINTYSKCLNNGLAAAPNVSKRNASALYYVETSGTKQIQCIDL